MLTPQLVEHSRAGLVIRIEGQQLMVDMYSMAHLQIMKPGWGFFLGIFCGFFLVFFMVFRSADARVSQLVDSRQSGQSVGQPTERPVSQSVSWSAGSGESVSQSVSQSVSRSSSGSGESVSQSVRLPTEPSISRAVDLALHLQAREYGVPESPNEGACLRYNMMNRNRQKRGRV